MRQVNKAGIDLIKSFESCRLKAYDDGVGVWTIGWGTTRGVKRGDVITQARADQLFEDDLAEFAEGVEELVTNDVNDNEFAALVSLAYNIGLAAFKRSSLLRAINRGDYDTAADGFLKWNKGGGKVMRGLTRRRQAERKLFLKSVSRVATKENNNIQNEAVASPPTLPLSEPSPTTQNIAEQASGTQNVVVAADTKPTVSTSPTEDVFQLASTGFSKVSKSLTAGTISTGVLSAVWGFAQANWVGIVVGAGFAIFLIACGVGIFLFAQHQATKRKLKEADIRSNPALFNIKV